MGAYLERVSFLEEEEERERVLINFLNDYFLTLNYGNYKTKPSLSFAVLSRPGILCFIHS